MEDNKIYIKNMVCRRCIMMVETVFNQNNVSPVNVELGVVTLSAPLGVDVFNKIRGQLESYGFEVLDDKRMKIIEQIRVAVIEFVRNPEVQDEMNLSDYVSDKCVKDYSALSKLFTEINGLSIEKYYIAQRVEYVKELLIYDELTVGEIADKLHYSSVAHLSAQFRTVTGLSPTKFKQLENKRIRPLDEL